MDAHDAIFTVFLELAKQQNKSDNGDDAKPPIGFHHIISRHLRMLGTLHEKELNNRNAVV
jgi:hypothetical protein